MYQELREKLKRNLFDMCDFIIGMYWFFLFFIKQDDSFRLTGTKAEVTHTIRGHDARM